MKIFYTFFISLLFYCHLKAQVTTTNTRTLQALDKSYFKWNEFSLLKPFSDVERIMGLKKVETYKQEYLNYFCGTMTDTSKAYSVTNNLYHRFNNIEFDDVYLCVKGNTDSRFCTTDLVFIKDLGDSNKSFGRYQEILKSFNQVFGEVKSASWQRYNEDSERVTIARGQIYESLKENFPFSAIEVNFWTKINYFEMEMFYAREKSLLIFKVRDRGLTSLNRPSFLFDSDYEEKHNETFRNFDKTNGYKGLKFGTPMSVLKNSVNFAGPNVNRQYEVKTEKYKEWFDLEFDGCLLFFNKRKQLSYVGLTMTNYSVPDYKVLVSEIVKLFGPPVDPIQNDEKIAIKWIGKNMLVSISYVADGFIVLFDSINFDDSDESDKLY